MLDQPGRVGPGRAHNERHIRKRPIQLRQVHLWRRHRVEPEVLHVGDDAYDLARPFRAVLDDQPLA
jgi:hypothetical protein